jgi:outer membrane protein assembly factor BamB
MTRLFLVGALLACVIALVIAPNLGRAQSTTPWSTFHGDTQRSGASAASGPNGSGGQLQAGTIFALPAGSDSSPAVDANGVAYIGDNDHNVYALDPASPNAPKWHFSTGGIVKSSPTLSGDGKTLYVGSEDGSVYAINTANGQKVWSVSLGGTIDASPLLTSDGSAVIVPTVSGTIYSLKTSDGSTLWTYPYQGAITGSLTLSSDNTTVYAAESNGTMYGIPVNGPSGSSGVTPFYLNLAPTSTPSIDPNGNIYVATSDGALTSFAPASSAPRPGWPYLVPSHNQVLASPAFYNGQAIFGDTGGLIRAVNQSNGQQTWQFPQTGTIGAIQSSAAITKGNNRLYVGSSDGFVYELDMQGNLIAKRNTSAPVISSPAVAPDGSVWVASENGNVYRFKDVPPPTVPSTPTPGPSPTPTATSQVSTTTTPTSGTPTATTTSSALVPLSISLKAKVKDGQHQTIGVTSAPSTVVKLRIEYPNGDHQSHQVTTDASGKGSYDYVQGASKTTHSHFDATVTAKAGTGSSQNTVTKTYTITFGKLDTSAEPRKLAVGKTVDIFVHAKKGTKVVVDLLFPNGTSVELRGSTGPKGFASIKYKIKKGLTKGSNHKVIVVVKMASGTTSTKTSFTIG